MIIAWLRNCWLEPHDPFVKHHLPRKSWAVSEHMPPRLAAVEIDFKQHGDDALRPPGELQLRSMNCSAIRPPVRDGVSGLTLRGVAREAGVSHAAPKNHFGDIRGLLSELAAVGFARFSAALVANVREAAPPKAQHAAIGHSYVTFARQNPGLFLLMFRSERLDFRRPALRVAADAPFDVLAHAVGARPQARSNARLALSQAAKIAAAWSLVRSMTD